MTHLLCSPSSSPLLFLPAPASSPHPHPRNARLGTLASSTVYRSMLMTLVCELRIISTFLDVENFFYVEHLALISNLSRLPLSHTHTQIRRHTLTHICQADETQFSAVPHHLTQFPCSLNRMERDRGRRTEGFEEGRGHGNPAPGGGGVG